jgi:hypothetical protein
MGIEHSVPPPKKRSKDNTHSAVKRAKNAHVISDGSDDDFVDASESAYVCYLYGKFKNRSLPPIKSLAKNTHQQHYGFSALNCKCISIEFLFTFLITNNKRSVKMSSRMNENQLHPLRQPPQLT